MFGQTGGEPGTQDAFHMAGVVVTSRQEVHPGDHVRFTSNSTVELCHKADRDGIVDPFADDIDGSFWVMLCPGMYSKPTHSFTVASDYFDRNLEDEYDDGCPRGCG